MKQSVLSFAIAASLAMIAATGFEGADHRTVVSDDIAGEIWGGACANWELVTKCYEQGGDGSCSIGGNCYRSPPSGSGDTQGLADGWENCQGTDCGRYAYGVDGCNS